MILYILAFYLCLLFVVYCIETRDRSFVAWPLLWLAVAGVAWYFWKGIDFRGLLQWSTLGYAAVYLVAGVIWSLVKWKGLVNKKYEEWKRYLSSNSHGDLKKNWFMPKIAEEKEQVSAWIFLWPFSIIRYCFENLLQDLVDQIIRSLSGLYKRITNSKFDEK